jgi:hypothetical protein
VHSERDFAQICLCWLCNYMCCSIILNEWIKFY